MTPQESGGESTERVYDPFWTNAREFLDTLDERGLIQHELEAASIGGLVLVSGTMEVIDLGLLKEMWQLPTLRTMLMDGASKKPQASESPPNRHARRAGSKAGQAAQPPSQEELSAKLMLELMPVLPPSLNVTLRGPAGKVWANLQKEHLIGKGSDLVLKHGISVPGQWHALGILDARPDLGGQGDFIKNSMIDLSNPAHLLLNNLAAHFAKVAAPTIRIAIGRPGTHYGITLALLHNSLSGGSCRVSGFLSG